MAPEDRRSGLTVTEQKEMYDKINKLHTILLGNGVKGKLKEFEDKDDQLSKQVASLTKKFWVATGAIGIIAFVAPFVADKIFP